jgi:CHASE3 domain sensor protein
VPFMNRLTGSFSMISLICSLISLMSFLSS